MAILQFEIRYPNGARESVIVEGERALIGSASFSDVRLPIDHSAHEHVLIEAVGGSLRVETKSDQPPVTLNGAPLATGPLATPAVIGVGRVQVFVNFVPDLVDGGAGSAKAKKESNPATQLGLVVMFGLAAYLLLTTDEMAIAPPPAEAPQIFSATTETCPQPDHSAASAYAEEQVEIGNSKRERMPFVVGDGIAAVGHFEVAAACYTHANLGDKAREARENADTLKRVLEDDFRARRIRLSHVLKVEDYSLARRDVRVLLDFLATKQGPYVDWLRQVSEQLKGKS